MVKKREDDAISRGRDNDGIKVNDRRLFTVDGDLRGELPEDDTDSKSSGELKADSARETDRTAAGDSADAVEKAKEESGFERRSLDEPEGTDFTMLINAMAQPALIFLGEVTHPGTGKAEINLEQARIQIDLLDILRIKCRGNLTPEEEGLLDRILYQLRMLYVSRSSQQQQ